MRGAEGSTGEAREKHGECTRETRENYEGSARGARGEHEGSTRGTQRVHGWVGIETQENTWAYHF
jgi:hypothetical protein